MRIIAGGIVVVIISIALLLGYLSYTNQVSVNYFSLNKSLLSSFDGNSFPSLLQNLFQKKIDQTETATNTNDNDSESFAKNSSEQLKILTERAQSVASQAQQVLGEAVQVNEKEKEKSLHEKAFDHARYLYCQEVIKEYESTSERQ